MRIRITQLVSALLFAVVAFSGCSAKRKLATQIASADRVVVTNLYGGFSFSLSREEAKKVVRAVSIAEKKDPLVAASLDLQLLFLRGTNLLASVNMCHCVIGIDRQPYSDTTGVLEALDDRFRAEEMKATLNGR